MNWHNVNKYILRRIIFVTGVAMLIMLINKINFMGVEIVAKYGEVRVITERYFLEAITPSFSGFFSKLFLVFVVMLLLSWKGFGEYKRSGIWLYNGAIGVLFVWHIEYVLLSLLAIKVFSWYTVLAGVMVIIYFMYFVGNVVYYTKHKEDMAEGSKITISLACLVVAIIAIVMLSVNFLEKYKDLWNDTEYKAISSMWRYDSDELVDEITYEDYIKLQYANYYNPEGEYFTIEEFEEAVNNYNNDKGSWYALWYVLDSRGCEMFYDYDMDDNGWNCYVKYVTRELEAKGIDPETATYEELDEACKYVYDVFAAQTEKTCIGDDEGEIVIHVELPENNNPNDVVLTYKGEGYYAVINEWYKVDDKDESVLGRDDPVENFEEGCMYKALVYVYTRVSYAFIHTSEKVYIEYEGAEVASDYGVKFDVESANAHYIYIVVD